MDKRFAIFDMDGTLADFYGVENWLTYLERQQTKPYREAKPLVNMKKLARNILFGIFIIYCFFCFS